MGLSLIQRRVSAWLLLLAMWLGALAPVVTQAVVSSGKGVGWVQICSVSGMSWVKVDANPDGPASSAASSGCTWCAAHASGGVLPGTSGWIAAALPLAVPWAAPASAVLARAWAPWQSRAPPSGV